MKYRAMLVLFVPFLPISIPAAEEPAALVEASLRRRAEIPLGGDFRPDPQQPVFVAVGHGGRILLSRDDGQTWTQVFWGHAGSDHGPWATKAVAYTNGVFVVPIGWGAPTAWLASEDGVDWRHLTDGQTKLTGMKEADGDPSVMPGTWGIAGGRGVFVTGGYMTMAATPDFGKTITTFSLRSFVGEPKATASNNPPTSKKAVASGSPLNQGQPRRKLVTHHVGPIYCGDTSGRFLALGNDRSTENPVFGNLFASDDQGKTWIWLEPQMLNEQCQGYSGIASNGQLVLIVDAPGQNVFRSLDAGNSWEGPFPTLTSRVTLSVVRGEFWLAGANSRASADGKVWRDLPAAVPSGKIAASDRGTLISIDRQRFNILRSADGGHTWSEVHSFQPETEHVHGAQGLRDIAFGYATAQRKDPTTQENH